jgi:hypothetical protein
VSEIQHSSDNTDSVEFLLETGLVVLIDPLALDGLKDTFDAQFTSRLVADERAVLSLPGGLRVGVHRVPAFTPGRYCLSRADIQEIEPSKSDDAPAVFDIDTGTLIAVDVRYLPVLAQVLTWQRYDWLLQSPVDDRSRWDEIVRESGGRCSVSSTRTSIHRSQETDVIAFVRRRRERQAHQPVDARGIGERKRTYQSDAGSLR